MKRLEYLLAHCDPIRFPEDVAKLKASIPELTGLPDGLVQKLYSDWGEDYYCAGWLMMSDGTLEEFASYLRAESKDDGTFPNEGWWNADEPTSSEDES